MSPLDGFGIPIISPFTSHEYPQYPMNIDRYGPFYGFITSPFASPAEPWPDMASRLALECLEDADLGKNEVNAGVGHRFFF